MIFLDVVLFVFFSYSMFMSTNVVGKIGYGFFAFITLIPILLYILDIMKKNNK